MTDRGSNGRRFGVLLPASALPGPGGIGTLGAPARRWLEWLHRAGAGVWQLLPLGPPGQGHSPYSALSSFAGDPLLVATARKGGTHPSRQKRAGQEGGTCPPAWIVWERVERERTARLRAAWERFARAPGERRRALEAFLEAPGQAGWLADWTLFAALSGSPLTGGERCWRRWPEALRRRDPAAVERARAALSAEVAFHGFVQFLFFEQVAALRRGAAALGIETIGDLPFYPALESADVWARPEIFDLDEGSRPRHVAGVPPDAYTDQGQLWGHPVLRWAEEPEACRRWWIERTRSALSQTDRVRLDHFRGYAAFWSVPADAETAAAGEWVEGPGAALFEAARAALGGLPFVAEDLGYITDDVRRLLADTGLPGMRVLQFAFGPEGAADHLPANVPEHGVYCTSTHDNDTARGWFATLGEAEARRVLETVDGRPETVHRDLLRAALESRAELVLAPVQDLLGLGSEARLNTPGVSHGQWAWRLGAVPGEAVADDLRRLVESSGRLTPRASSPPA